MKCAIYIRVSSDMQESNYSLAAQTGELNRYAEQQQWQIIGEFKDVESGGKLNKKGLNSMLDLVEEGYIDVVLCIDQDRLSRLDTVAWEYLKSTLRDNNVKIAEPGNVTDLKDEDQEFISDIKNLIARREKKSIVKRMMRGKRQRMREGKPWGKAPIGYIYDKTNERFVIDDNWAWVIPTIDKLYLEKELGMQAIANRLNEISRTPKGGLWNETLVHRRLISKAFHGIMEKTFSNGEVITIEDIYPPLRSKVTYDRIQDERMKRGKRFKVTSRQREDLHMLRRTLITCGLCERKLNLHQNGNSKKPRYYLKHGRTMKLNDETVCDISINTKRVDQNIVNAVKDILTSEEFAKKYVDLQVDNEEFRELQSSLNSVTSSLNSNQEKLDKLLDLYLDGSFSKDQLSKRQTALQQEVQHLQSLKDGLERKVDMFKKQEWNYDTLYEYMEIAEGFDKELSPAEQARMVGNLFPHVKVFEDKLLLLGELEGGAPLQLEIPIDSDPYKWHHSKTAEYKQRYEGRIR
ncbi:DNA invertase Pin-like site-specific DNA recombinase/exonuclease VII small subunit [Salibacterium salarium]|uniref:recombinase family protein n=1 Tax=Salibacterium salarium TaxID=284579 RepID=UPI00277EDEA5|nr:recombinase family protein [Salibacterium salarium]MDQ0299690.1 DNA invertase Pin-like site-specific DNA recombinase/exonuclease VII small subunit [Salibacterium salarium]